jgi:hypothetical protein
MQELKLERMHQSNGSIYVVVKTRDATFQRETDFSVIRAKTVQI